MSSLPTLLFKRLVFFEDFAEIHEPNIGRTGYCSLASQPAYQHADRLTLTEQYYRVWPTSITQPAFNFDCILFNGIFTLVSFFVCGQVWNWCGEEGVLRFEFLAWRHLADDCLTIVDDCVQWVCDYVLW